MALAGMAPVSAILIMAVRHSLPLSIGAAGLVILLRLKIVINELSEAVFLVWTLSVGIALGSGCYLLALSGTVIISFLLMAATPPNHEISYTLIFSCKDEKAEKTVLAYINQNVIKNVLKEKTIYANGIQLVNEVRLSSNSTYFVNELIKINGVEKISMLRSNP